MFHLVSFNSLNKKYIDPIFLEEEIQSQMPSVERDFNSSDKTIPNRSSIKIRNLI